MADNQQITNNEWVKSPYHSLVNEREFAIFQLGKERGATEESAKLQEIISHNFSKSYHDTTKVLEKLYAENVDVISARLKIKSVYSFEIMLSVKDSELLAGKIERIYNFIYDLEASTNEENYFVDFSIIKANEKFSDSGVENDGYIYKHRLIINEEISRPA